MKIIKPAQLMVGMRTLETKGTWRAVWTLGACFSTEGAQQLLLEQGIWLCTPDMLPLDEGLPKPCAEVLMVGSAHSANGKPTEALPVRLVLGPLDKQLWVVGDRVWQANGASKPIPFVEIPLCWERAFGGNGFEDNPVGRGVADARLPNIEWPKQRIRKPTDRPTPACFAPVAMNWQPRSRHLGSYDQHWLEQRYPGLPDDLDPRLWHMAPADQRLKEGFFVGNERYRVEGMHPDHPVLTGQLPNLSARLRVEQADRTMEVVTHLDSVVFAPTAERFVLFFRGVLEVADEDASDVEQVLAALERRGAPQSDKHYQWVVDQRNDSRWGALASMRDSDLLPADILHESLFPSDETTEPNTFFAQRVRASAEQRLLALRQELRERDIDPDAHLPKELPPLATAPSLHELPDVVAQLDADASDADARIELAKREADTRVRTQCLEHGVDYDEMVQQMASDTAGPPELLDPDQQIENLRHQQQLAMNAGVTLPHVETLLADGNLREKWQARNTVMLEVYRDHAHHMPAAAALTGEAQTHARARVEHALRAGTSLAGADLTGADLSGLDLSGADLTGALMEAAHFDGATLRDARLDGAVLTRAALQGVTLAGASLVGTNLGYARLENANLDHVDARNAVLWGTTLNGATLRQANLVGADMTEAALDGADFSGADLSGSRWMDTSWRGVIAVGAKLTRAIFLNVTMDNVHLEEADLTNATLVNVKTKGLKLRGAQASKLTVVENCSLRGAELVEITLTGAYLGNCDLRGADLSRAILDGTNLDGADLRNARLYRARARDARFVKADLRGADCTSMNLMNTLLLRARLAGTNFKGANLFRADFGRAVGDKTTNFHDALVDEVRLIKPAGGLARINQ